MQTEIYTKPVTGISIEMIFNFNLKNSSFLRKRKKKRDKLQSVKKEKKIYLRCHWQRNNFSKDFNYSITYYVCHEVGSH